ncbi:hypothetical protein PV325_013980 [Microctonus aethiopoides]|nr:hypothetical protein PV325_013980 [Microctonus aethiopoides]
MSSEWTDHSEMSHLESAETPSENNIRNNEMDESSDSEDERHLEGNILTNAGMEKNESTQKKSCELNIAR